MNPNKRLRLANEKTDAAKVAYDNAHYQQAVDFYLESAELFKSLRGIESELNYAACLVNAANALGELGNYNQAKRLLEIALPIQKKILGSEKPNVAQSLNNLADIYYKEGNYEKAKELHQKSLAIKEKTLPYNHPSIAASLNNLANVYDDLGEYEKAKELHEKALAIREKTLSSDHPDIAKSLNNLAGIYQAQGEYEKAKELIEKSLTIWEKTLPSNHPEIAVSLNNLAEVYKKQGDTQKAEEYLQRAQNLINKTFDENHPTSKLISENYLKLQTEVEELRKRDIEQRFALKEASKLHLSSEMATLIAHNVNNPVGIIRLAAQRGLRKLEKGMNIDGEIFQRILEQTDRLHESVQDFRNIANANREYRENVFLNYLVQKVQSYFENQLEAHNIKLVLDFSDKNPQTYANNSVLQEILINLISNAREALENISEATIWIKTWQKGNKVGFIVEDNGLGISEEQQKNLFSPFHSTKENGMGLGLYFTHRALTELNGTIIYQDREPNGAYFLIELPRLHGATHD